MVSFKRNKETGIVEVWKDGKYVGKMLTMGDEVTGNDDGKLSEQRERSQRRYRESTSSGGRSDRRHG